MSALAALIAETASMFQDIERAEQEIRGRGEPMPTTTGNPWRQLAACQRELEVLTGKSKLADRIAAGGMSAGEFMEEWNALEELRRKGKSHAVTG